MKGLGLELESFGRVSGGRGGQGSLCLLVPLYLTPHLLSSRLNPLNGMSRLIPRGTPPILNVGFQCSTVERSFT
jgi:hypothetical protein